MNEIDLHERVARGVPLFPLPNLALLPGLATPFRIFEPRYAAMTRDALSGDRLIAMATLKPGFEADYFGTPAIYPIVCIGEVTAERQRGEGLYHITLQGLARATVMSEETTSAGYRLAQLQLIVEQLAATEIAMTHRLACDVAELLRRTLPDATGAPATPTSDESSIISFSYEVV